MVPPEPARDPWYPSLCLTSACRGGWGALQGVTGIRPQGLSSLIVGSFGQIQAMTMTEGSKREFW